MNNANRKAMPRLNRRKSISGCIEALESRDLPATSIVPRELMEGSKKVLYIEGTEQNDTIYIEQSTSSDIINVGDKPGSIKYGSFSGIKLVRVNVLGGNDKVDLHGVDQKKPVRVPAELFGGVGNDTLTGGNGDDHIEGGTNQKTLLKGKTDKDTLKGGQGNDTVIGQEGTDQLYGNEGVDYLYGGEATNSESSGTDLDFLYGGAGGDFLFGGGGSDFLNGEGGNDVIHGGAGGDNLVGGDGYDQLFGDADTDTLYGELVTNKPKNTVENWLEAGAINDPNAASERAVDGYNAFKPVVGGMQLADIKQQSSLTCSFLAALGATVKTGRLSEKQIVYKGNFKYELRFYDPANQLPVTCTATFDGHTVYHDFGQDNEDDFTRRGYQPLDPATPKYEFWVLLYQRAYFAAFHNMNYVTSPELLAKFKGETADEPMACLMPFTFQSFTSGDPEFDPANIKSILNQGYAVTAGLEAPELSSDVGHAYVITNVTGVSGIAGFTYYIELYNPWGVSEISGVDPSEYKSFSTKTPGLFSLKFDDFEEHANDFTW